MSPAENFLTTASSIVTDSMTSFDGLLGSFNVLGFVPALVVVPLVFTLVGIVLFVMMVNVPSFMVFVVGARWDASSVMVGASVAHVLTAVV